MGWACFSFHETVPLKSPACFQQKGRGRRGDRGDGAGGVTTNRRGKGKRRKATWVNWEITKTRCYTHTSNCGSSSPVCIRCLPPGNLKERISSQNFRETETLSQQGRGPSLSPAPRAAGAGPPAGAPGRLWGGGDPLGPKHTWGSADHEGCFCRTQHTEPSTGVSQSPLPGGLPTAHGPRQSPA